VQVTVVRDARHRVVVAPATAIVTRPTGPVFVVEAGPARAARPARVARQQFVRLGAGAVTSWPWRGRPPAGQSW